MPASNTPSPNDRYQREIDDIIRLAEKRLERQSIGYKARRQTRGVQDALGRFHFPFRLPSAEILAGWGLALLLISWLLSLIGGFIPLGGLIRLITQSTGILLLAMGLILSLTRGRTGVGYGGSGGTKMWRGEQVSYGNPYGDHSLVRRLRRWFSRR